ncbi:hypothetical protein TVAG_037240 [Trichomonas vaginalis G3]|uniref:DUF3447 domain-containing protein n=1 Tax=Trichomonas vaginalis (strain ATCC PRA-98 / G3) TaxID=412133 RepID=A2G0T1_TRIV3|nr:ankyrin repeat and SOCS box-containing protein 4 family [Trichomonas vaginalis G3]EAX89239.1 hypothetical protein TVAG_037240 [Trichomonas vaginalis G3]KAI5507022.1 ankyrin repeat and SOCS box-containing protein 4 family [Trichomonas vaginalis G3]|eukprot:XP_001302169.1 hypothetical protein [Trichomonas vaginalis G3]
MSDQNTNHSKYNELKSMCKRHIDTYNVLYQLKTPYNEDLISIYKVIKTNLIDSMKILPCNIVKGILDIIPYNKRYAKTYLELAKIIVDEYHVKNVTSIPFISNFLFYKKYGIKLHCFEEYEREDIDNLDKLEENTIYRAIMYDAIETFIYFIEREGFKKDQKHYRKLLYLCCYHGAINCFKYLRKNFNLEITHYCLESSFLGRNPEIVCECLKYQKPNDQCMVNAIISHNIDFVKLLMNEYHLDIDLYECGHYNNIESLLYYYEKTNDYNKCFINSSIFDIPSLSEYFFLLGANVNAKDHEGETALHLAARFNCRETTELIISFGANVNEENKDGATPLNIAAEFDSPDAAKILLSHNANDGEAFYIAASNNSKAVIELFLLHGANVNGKDNTGNTALHIAAIAPSNEAAEFLLLNGANPNEKDKYGQTALHIAAEYNRKEIVEILLSHGANVNEKDRNGQTPLHTAIYNLNRKICEMLLSHGAKVNEKDKDGNTVLQIAKRCQYQDISEVFHSYGVSK